MTKYKYSYFRNYIFRTPSGPFDPDKLKNIDLEKAKEIFDKDSFLKEALYFASRGLYDEINSQDKKMEGNEKLQEALLKYILRIQTRCTPFGLFAGSSSLGSIQKVTSGVLLKEMKFFKKHIRLDMGVLYNISKHLVSFSEIRENVRFFPNNTLYKIGDHLRYIEARVGEEQIEYLSNSIETDEYLEKVLALCKAGAFISDIINMLKNEGFDDEDTKDFCNELIDNQVLLSELELSSIEVQPLERLLSIIKGKLSDKNRYIIDELEQIVNLFKKKLTDNEDNSIDDYNNILKENDFLKTFSVKNNFQVDLNIITNKNVLSEDTVSILLEGIDVLNKLSLYHANAELEIFKAAFLEKYEYQEVPLLKVLDQEIGLGYPISKTKLISPLIDDIHFAKPGRESFEVPWNVKYSFITNKLGEFFACDDRGSEIVLKEEELSKFTSSEKNLPATLSALVEVYSTKEGELLYLPGLSSSAINYYGRFAYCDLEIERFIKEQLYAKEKDFLDDNSIFAEISHFPDARVGNILLRPSFTEYEIPILAGSLLPPENQILLSDLMVSVRNDEVVLRSIRLNKRIIPRLSTAHNYKRPDNLSIYKFLCEIYNQNDKKNIGFDWGVLANFPYLPRIIYKNLILSKARWSFNAKIFQSFSNLSDEELMGKISEWKKKNRLPSDVVLKDFDNKLYINLDNITLVKLLLHAVKNRTRFILEEFIFSKDNGFIFDEKGNMFTNEFIISFYKNK